MSTFSFGNIQILIQSTSYLTFVRRLATTHSAAKTIAPSTLTTLWIKIGDF